MPPHDHLRSLYPILFCFLLLTACAKKDDYLPPAPPEPPKDLYLVSSITINGIPRDSLIYDNRHRLQKRWIYDNYYKEWSSYVLYIYETDGRLRAAYNYYTDPNHRSYLTSIDSLGWEPKRFITYTTFYREEGEAISGYDTTKNWYRNEEGRLGLIGSKSWHYTFVGKQLAYEEFDYHNNNLTGYTFMDHYLFPDQTSNLQQDIFTITYGELPNALYPITSRNPLLLAEWAKAGYPYFGSEYLATAIQLTSSQTASPSVAIQVTGIFYPGSNYMQEQWYSGINKKILYRYKIIKAR
ncbi:hypothetical protein [Chitinophaga nivalis]|uniref:DUF4595 domain-containing protein n=1 Tax=Chitinophaga nivalis TaxID=2991709 RepID=A0ABT3IFW5_9BACT|nr:hypothetical protein [Chitinophaga nivalis]MCW3467454.1 hypothetical protein [Chitinophaga nivalis]MCW3482854.1 hypothetical protein [Chitinophaga nivalis]